MSEFEGTRMAVKLYAKDPRSRRDGQQGPRHTHGSGSGWNKRSLGSRPARCRPLRRRGDRTVRLDSWRDRGDGGDPAIAPG